MGMTTMANKPTNNTELAANIQKVIDATMAAGGTPGSWKTAAAAIDALIKESK